TRRSSDLLLSVSRYSVVWSLAQVDLTAYAGQRVRLGFNHTDVSEDTNRYGGIQHYEASGWYLDEVSVEKRPRLVFSGSEGFEGGWNGWFAENGIWEIGVPTNEIGRASCRGRVVVWGVGGA